MFLVVPAHQLARERVRQTGVSGPARPAALSPQDTDTSRSEHSAQVSDSKMVFLNQAPTHPLEAELLREKMRSLWEWTPPPPPPGVQCLHANSCWSPRQGEAEADLTHHPTDTEAQAPQDTAATGWAPPGPARPHAGDAEEEQGRKQPGTRPRRDLFHSQSLTCQDPGFTRGSPRLQAPRFRRRKQL